MRAIADGEARVDRAFAEEMSYCLGCLACQTACPAGVHYAELFEAGRAEVEASGQSRGLMRSFWRWLTLRVLFQEPGLLRWVGRVLRWVQRGEWDVFARDSGLTQLLPSSLRRLEPQTPRMSDRFSDECIAPVERPVGVEKRWKVALLTGCVQDLAFSEINRDTVDVLLANGCEVHTASQQPCCGSLHCHNGEPSLAADLARRMIQLMPPAEFDAVITNAGGCGSHLRQYGALLAADERYAEQGRLWDSKVRDIHEWLEEIGVRVPAARLDAGESRPTVVSYHDSCHLAHGQKVVQQPRKILSKIPGVTLVELPEASWCCGSAGVYSITQPEQSGQLLERKVRHVLSTGARVLATANPGCHLQILNGLREAGSLVEVVHPVTLLARAYRNEAGGRGVLDRDRNEAAASERTK